MGCARGWIPLLPPPIPLLPPPNLPLAAAEVSRRVITISTSFTRLRAKLNFFIVSIYCTPYRGRDYLRNIGRYIYHLWRKEYYNCDHFVRVLSMHGDSMKSQKPKYGILNAYELQLKPYKNMHHERTSGFKIHLVCV